MAYFCLSALVRRQWAEHEKFSFPLVQLPILLAETPSPGHRSNGLLRSPLLWWSVAGVTCLHTIKGLHLLVPTVPDVPTVWHTQDVLTNPPWNSVGDIQLAVYPLVIGFAYLLSNEVCFSLWLFYLLYKAQIVFAVAHDWSLSGVAGNSFGPAFEVYHEAGGVLMTSLWLLYRMRGHLGLVWRKAIQGAADVDDTREPLSYRFAVFGAAVAFGGLFGWLILAAGIQPLMACGMLIGAFAVFVVLSWLVAQAGLLFVSETFSSPQIMTAFFGTTTFSTQSLALSSLTEHVGWFDAREFMMPSLLNATQGASETQLSARSLTRALALCVPLATLAGGMASIWLPYTHRGALVLKNSWSYVNSPQFPFQWTAGQISNLHPPDVAAMLHMAAGAALVLALFASRTYLVGFTLHPAGFLFASSWAMYTLWFSLLLAWIAKVPILRYGGIRLYRLLLPLFLGLILGDCLNAIVWTVIGLITGTGYRLLPA